MIDTEYMAVYETPDKSHIVALANENGTITIPVIVATCPNYEWAKEVAQVINERLRHGTLA